MNNKTAICSICNKDTEICKYGGNSNPICYKCAGEKPAKTNKKNSFTEQFKKKLASKNRQLGLTASFIFNKTISDLENNIFNKNKNQ